MCGAESLTWIGVVRASGGMIVGGSVPTGSSLRPSIRLVCCRFESVPVDDDVDDAGRSEICWSVRLYGES